MRYIYYTLTFSLQIMRTIIIDDEITARAAIREEVALYCPRLVVVGEADGLASALSLIEQLRPDLVLLDIQLGDGTGFQLLDQVRWKSFQVVFITGYDQYAIHAFKANAIDYLLKPFHPKELTEAVEKAALQKEYSLQSAALKRLLENQQNGLGKKVAIPLTGGVSLYDQSEILHLEAMGNYSKIYLRDKETLLSARTLKEYEDALQIYGFERVHHSHLVNLAHLRKYVNNRDGHFLELSDGSIIPISKRKKAHILSMLERISV